MRNNIMSPIAYGEITHLHLTHQPQPRFVFGFQYFPLCLKLATKQCSLSGHKSHAVLYLADAVPISATTQMGWVFDGREQTQHHMCTEDQEGSENVSEFQQVETVLLRWHGTTEGKRQRDLVEERRSFPHLKSLDLSPHCIWQSLSVSDFREKL